MIEPENNKVTVEELSEGFLAHLKAGEQPSINEYCKTYPEHADEIAELFPTMLALEQLGMEHGASRQLERLDSVVRESGTECFGDYRVVREIGRGGMGVVYEAVQESLGRRVALKVLAADFTASPADRQRFKLEAEAAGKLCHTNIVPVYGVGRHDHLRYYVMQYIDGTGLDNVPQFEDWRTVADIGLQVARALDYAHGQGVIHRDIKPSNLLMDNEGRVWVADFGLARQEGSESVTMSGGMVGTLRYMAPEQFRGDADARSDVHSLGLTLYELLVRVPAFPETGHGELVRLKTTTEAPKIRDRNPDIPRDLATIVHKACALGPRHRYQTAGELADDLQRLLDDRPIHARRVTSAERLWRWSRRNPAIASLSGLAVLLLLAVAAVSTLGYFHTMQALDEANHQRGRAETNLTLALEGFEKIMGDISARGVPRSLAFDAAEEGIASDTPPLSAADAELLQTMLVFFDRFATENQTDLKAETATAYHRVGDIRQRLGQYAVAKDAYRKAIGIHESISQTVPNDVPNTLAHVRALNALGMLETEAGAWRDAQSAHMAALGVLDGMRNDEAGLMLERARTLNLLGSVGVRSNDSMMGAMRRRKGRNAAGGRRPSRGGVRGEEMEKYYTEALELLQSLCQSDPANADYRHELALCRRNHVLLALKEADVSKTQLMLDAAIHSFEELTEDFPDAPEYQYELADSLCLQSPGHRGSAPISEDRAARAVDISQRLVSAYPWMPNYQALLATALSRRAAAEEGAGRVAEATDSYRASVTQFKLLTGKPGSTEAYELAYAKVLLGLGDVLRNQDRIAESRDVLEQAQALIEAHGRSRQPAYRGLMGRLGKSLADTRTKLEAGK